MLLAVSEPYAADLASIRAATERIEARVQRTPVLTSSTLDRRAGRSLFFKCESFQRGGAFKARGATNAISLLERIGSVNRVKKVVIASVPRTYPVSQARREAAEGRGG